MAYCRRRRVSNLVVRGRQGLQKEIERLEKRLMLADSADPRRQSALLRAGGGPKQR